MSVHIPQQSSLSQWGERGVKMKAEHAHIWLHPPFRKCQKFILSSHYFICDGNDSLLDDVFHIISRIEANLSILEPPFAPTLIILLANFYEFISCRGEKRSSWLIAPTY